MTLLSIAEMVSKTTEQRKLIEEQMDQSGNKGGFHPEEVSIFDNQGIQDRADIYETLRTVSLSQLIYKAAPELGLKLNMTEFLGKSGTTGIAGAAYLIPDKIHQVMQDAARGIDIVPFVSPFIECPGSSVKYDLEVDGQFAPHFVASGGASPQETIEPTQVTITPRQFSIHPKITYDLIEDAQFDVMERHMAAAGKAMGELSTKMFLYLFMAEHASASTYGGDGTLNTASGTAFSDIIEANDELIADGYTMDTIILNPYANQGLYQAESAKAGNYFDWMDAVNLTSLNIGKLFGANVIQATKLTTSDAVDSTAKTAGLYASHWHNIALNKMAASATVRKRWLKIENYSDPVKDLVGAVVSARQGSNLLYRDAITMISS